MGLNHRFTFNLCSRNNSLPASEAAVITEQTLKYTNGETYTGEALGSLRHGRGVQTSPSGDKYDGKWYLDKRDGDGSFAGANGLTYNGQWKDDAPHW